MLKKIKNSFYEAKSPYNVDFTRNSFHRSVSNSGCVEKEKQAIFSLKGFIKLLVEPGIADGGGQGVPGQIHAGLHSQIFPTLSFSKLS